MPLSLVPRLRLDVGFGVLAGAWRPLWGVSRAGCSKALELAWGRDILPCLSVRSGLDLFLEAMAFKPGSEVLMSALNLPDMVAIVRAHGLVPVFVDVDPGSLLPALADLRAARSDQCVLLVVAQLFGGFSDLSEIGAWAESCGLVVFEDCAQAYRGPHFRGSSRAACTAFSFGTIKSRTCGGGAILVVRDQALRLKMIDLERRWPVFSDARFLKRLVKMMVFCGFGFPLVYGLLWRCLDVLGFDPDTVLLRVSKGFPGEDLLPQVRKRVPLRMLRLMVDRLVKDDGAWVQTWRAEAEQTLAKLPDGLQPLGQGQDFMGCWVLACVADDPEPQISRLRGQGVDAYRHVSMQVLDADCDTAAYWRKVVFLPRRY